jgi:hypothetical protein
VSYIPHRDFPTVAADHHSGFKLVGGPEPRLFLRRASKLGEHHFDLLVPIFDAVEPDFERSQKCLVPFRVIARRLAGEFVNGECVLGS